MFFPLLQYPYLVILFTRLFNDLCVLIFNLWKVNLLGLLIVLPVSCLGSLVLLVVLRS